MSARVRVPGAHALLAALGFGTLLLAWWGLTRGEELALAARFSPRATFESLRGLLHSPDLLHHVGVSLQRVLVGLGVATAIGVPLGLVVGTSAKVEAATSVVFQFLRMISPLSWMPIAVMAFGIGEQPIYFLLAIAAVWPVLLATASGVRQLEPRWIELGRSLNASRFELFWHIVLPGVLGHVLTGVRLAIGVLWIVLVPCEMLGVSAGIGYAILDTRDRLAYSELMALVLLVGVLGYALDALARGASRWRGAAEPSMKSARGRQSRLESGAEGGEDDLAHVEQACAGAGGITPDGAGIRIQRDCDRHAASMSRHAAAGGPPPRSPLRRTALLLGHLTALRTLRLLAAGPHAAGGRLSGTLDAVG